ncbi:MAG: Uracil phosphoribosyltransferase [Candidatus Moanabacter tarae]|uniref:Uracil phosphoribosyltransferase n=1 Tax=Candidatus Moanibacter tarae TaxID=2200854 RepID=A0A2Z4AFP8_9BACT|nr:MAG: Uracil phosphoribosyltransferase [Candidatus Moanabacter tarae]
MTLRVIDHPICKHVLSLLRDRKTSSAAFCILSGKVTTILALEATRDLPIREIDIVTPLEVSRGVQIAVPVVVVVCFASRDEHGRSGGRSNFGCFGGFRRDGAQRGYSQGEQLLLEASAPERE